HRWLIHERYRHLAEAPDGWKAPWGDIHREPFSLCPLDPGSIALLRELYDELLPHFSSHQFNVGCDETFDLGQGRSKQACEEPPNAIVCFYTITLRELRQRSTFSCVSRPEQKVFCRSSSSADISLQALCQQKRHHQRKAYSPAPTSTMTQSSP
ncbi:MAG: hypothetical protein ACK47M_08230, partial [Caldilinea sp.]